MDDGEYRLYVGRRGIIGPAVVQVLTQVGGSLALDPRLDLWSHSPSGFNWGYAGSGPAQTALALLADATGDDSLAVRLHQDFKHEVVSGWDNYFAISRAQILLWVCHKCEELLADVVDLREFDDREACDGE